MIDVKLSLVMALVIVLGMVSFGLACVYLWNKKFIPAVMLYRRRQAESEKRQLLALSAKYPMTVQSNALFGHLDGYIAFSVAQNACYNTSKTAIEFKFDGQQLLFNGATMTIKHRALGEVALDEEGTRRVLAAMYQEATKPQVQSGKKQQQPQAQKTQVSKRQMGHKEAEAHIRGNDVFTEDEADQITLPQGFVWVSVGPDEVAVGRK